MRVTIVVEDGLVVVDGVGYRGLDLAAVSSGVRVVGYEPAPVAELAAEPVADPVAEPADGPNADPAAGGDPAAVADPAPAPAAEPVAITVETRVHAVQWDGAAGWVEEYSLAGEPLPNRLIDSLDAFQPALDAHAAAHAAATKVKPPTMSEIRSRALMEVDQQHQLLLLRLTGNPTEAERNTWAGKVELARRVLAGETLLQDQEAFLQARGLESPGARKAYAAEVMGNSAKYWTLVGMADKVRSEAKARIMNVQTMAGWKACGKLNREAAEQVLAEAMASLEIAP